MSNYKKKIKIVIKHSIDICGKENLYSAYSDYNLLNALVDSMYIVFLISYYPIQSAYIRGWLE